MIFKRLLRCLVLVISIRVVTAASLLHGIKDGALDIDAILNKSLPGQGDLTRLIKAKTHYQQAGACKVSDDRRIGDGENRRRVDDHKIVKWHQLRQKIRET